MNLYIKYLMAIAIFIGITSCENYIGGDINADPNNPTALPVSAQLPAFHIALADVYGGDFSRFSSMLSQQVEGVARQWSSFNQYTGLTPNRFDTAWQNIYENVLNEVRIARVSVDENGYNHYKGVLDITEAFAIMIATDVWDDIPYSEALSGIENSSPTYDSQASIYDAVFALLDSAISSLASAPGSLVPGGDDVFYGGDVDLWTAAARAIKARAFLHQDNYAAALTEAQASFADASQNLAFQYPDANSAGSWYRFNRDRTGDLEFHPTMRALMTDLGDSARLSMMDQTFVPEHTYLVPDFLSELITYREMQFIIAESAFRTGDATTAYDAYLNGIKASFDRLGVSDAYDAYIAQGSIAPGADGLTLDLILNQKYIAMFLQPEVYADYRRTNVPNLVPVSGANVPVRWDYSSDEYLFNSNAPSEGDVNVFTDRVGWNR